MRVLTHSVQEDWIFFVSCSLSNPWIIAQKEDWCVFSPNERFRKDVVDVQKPIWPRGRVEGLDKILVVEKKVGWCFGELIPRVFVHVSPRMAERVGPMLIVEDR